jgi:hypothetical protein
MIRLDDQQLGLHYLASYRSEKQLRHRLLDMMSILALTRGHDIPFHFIKSCAS